MSGHNSYWLWGPDAGSWDVLIIIGGDREDNARYFDEIEIVGQTRSQWSMPYERGLDVSIARRPKIDFRELWPALKRYHLADKRSRSPPYIWAFSRVAPAKRRSGR